VEILDAAQVVAEFGGADLHDECGRRGIGIPVGLELRAARRGLQDPGVLRCSAALHVAVRDGVSFPSRSRSTCSPGAYPAKGDISCHEYSDLEILVWCEQVA
jgi:hypothetical protein